MLAAHLAEAMAEDEAPGAVGCDARAGLHGSHVSAWLRDVAEQMTSSAVKATPKVLTVIDGGSADMICEEGADALVIDLDNLDRGKGDIVIADESWRDLLEQVKEAPFDCPLPGGIVLVPRDRVKHMRPCTVWLSPFHDSVPPMRVGAAYDPMEEEIIVADPLVADMLNRHSLWIVRVELHARAEDEADEANVVHPPGRIGGQGGLVGARRDGNIVFGLRQGGLDSLRDLLVKESDAPGRPGEESRQRMRG